MDWQCSWTEQEQLVNSECFLSLECPVPLSHPPPPPHVYLMPCIVHKREAQTSEPKTERLWLSSGSPAKEIKSWDLNLSPHTPFSDLWICPSWSPVDCRSPPGSCDPASLSIKCHTCSDLLYNWDV